MKIVRDKISIEELKKLAESMFGDFVKAVVDVEKKIMAVGGELHADEEALLIKNGSEQTNLWGINIYLENGNEKRIEFDSMINLRLSSGNRSHGMENSDTRKVIIEVVNNLIEE